MCSPARGAFLYGDLSGNNSSEFNALPAGTRWDSGRFGDFTTYSGWWVGDFSTSVDLCANQSTAFGGAMSDGNRADKNNGCSVRIVKD